MCNFWLLILIEPANALTTLPLTFPFFSIGVNECSDPMLHSVFKISYVNATIGVFVFTITMFLVLEETSIVRSSVWPSIHTFPVHIILKPATLKDTTVAPVIPALPSDHVFLPLAVEDTIVRPCVYSVTMFHSIEIAANISGAIFPNLLTLTFLAVLIPLSFIS